MHNNIFWIRNDLRVEDNTALSKAIEITYKEKKKLILIFHINTEQIIKKSYSNDYFFSALYVFYRKILSLGSDILFLYGKPEDSFNQFFSKYKNIDKVFFNLSERGYGLQRDKKIIKIFNKNNVEVYKYFDKHLHGVSDVLTQDNNHYKVFTPYYNKYSSIEKLGTIKFKQDKFSEVMTKNFDNPYKIEFDKILDNRVKQFDMNCGEDRAIDELDEFVKSELYNYKDNRDDFILNLNSDMSKYLSTGQISPRQIYARVLSEEFSEGRDAYVRQLAWRDFYNVIYYVNPKQESQEIIEKFRNIKWNNDKYLFNIWKFGITGYPLVDAAMRHLLKTGKMHNRLRMIVSSFLIKDLMIDWRMGEAYFKQMLIDYDSASNIGSWQWSASTGTDACPYFRIFNPISQSKKYDKEGRYIKQHVEELKDVEPKYIHEPYKHANKILKFEYFSPVVDHKEQRIKVLDMYSQGIFYETKSMKNEFIKRYTLYKLGELKKMDKKNLMKFHAENKYLYFCYDVNIKDKLGKVLAKKNTYFNMYNEYRVLLKELFTKIPSVGNAVNAYEHIYGYFKKLVEHSEKDRYFSLLETYKKKEEELELKVFLLNLAHKYNINYIKKQSLLDTEYSVL